MIDFKGLETFVWVATLGSFRGAANRLHITQPAVSQRLAQLEADLGVKLLDRESQLVAPTSRGRALLGYAEKLLGLRAEMLSAFSDVSTLRGVLRLGVAETIVHSWLTRFIKRIDATYPHLGLEIEVDISPNLRDRLLAQEIDLAFMMGPVAMAEVHNRPLCGYPVGFIATPRIASVPHQMSLRELAAFPIITFPRNTQPYVVVRTLFQRPDLPPVRLHASASLSTVVHMAVEGLGIAVIPPAIVHGELADGRLRLIETTVRLPDLTFYSCWRASPDMRASEQLAQIATETAAQNSPSGHSRSDPTAAHAVEQRD